MSTVRIRGIRPFYLCGKVIGAGEIVTASPTDAAAAVGSSRAEFVTSADREQAKAGVIAADAAACPQVRAARQSFWSRDS